MSNKIEPCSSRDWRVEGVTSRRDSDPELRKKFVSLFTSRDGIENRDGKNELSTCLTKSVVNQLSEVNHIVTWRNAEILRGDNSLTFRLLNGPMMGLTIIASWESQIVTLRIKPKNNKQNKAITRMAPKIAARLSQSKIRFQMEIMNYE
ncbi:hypothetical protein [Vibrio hepatarius]|uniref:hypothetical protein n=1 Tax=Vibrio hepatarius TaxID=171383 RepID=UPI001C083A2B|nr:hypothetical protein [Vibrio hepatarius]MBU2898902.1 hypothetical protein [Vibrio hepatarius]